MKRQLKNSTWFNWLLVVLWAGGIFFVSSLSLPQEDGKWAIPHLDKYVHAVIFAVLSILVYIALYNSGLEQDSRRGAGDCADIPLRLNG